MADAWAALSRKVERVIGEPLPDSPDLSAPQWRRLVGRLGEANPSLLSEVLDAATQSDLRLPAEEEAAAEHARERVRQSLLGRFLRPDGLRTGAKRFNLRKAVNYIIAAVIIGIFAWSLIPKSPRVAGPAPRAATGPAANSAGQPASSTYPSTALVPPAASASAPSAGNAPAGASVLGIPVAPVPAATEPGVPIPPVPEGASPAGAVPSLPGADLSRGVILYETSRQSKAVVAYQQERPEGESSRSESVVVYAARPEARPAVPDAPAAAPAQSSGVIVYQHQPASPTKQSAEASAEPTAALPRRGQLVTVRLVNPVAVAANWPAAPVLAEVIKGGPEGALLFGQATLANTGVIAIAFTAVLTSDGKEIPLAAAAYDPAVGRLGIAGSVSTMMPGSAAATLQASLSAASDYAQQMAEQQQVTITNGFLTITQGQPNFWFSLASSLAKAFTPPTNSTTGPVVVTRIDKGTLIAAMVL